MDELTQLPRILVVDDDEKIRRFMSDLLSADGCQPVVAGTAQEALTLVEGGEIDLTISDIKMPGMDGLELLHQIKSINPSMPVAIMTGLGTAENAIAALNRGAFNFIVKPFRVKEILKVVRRGLDIRESVRRATELRPFARARVEHVLPSRMELVNTISSQLTEIANVMGYFLDTKRMEFRLVVDELVTNAVLHGNQQQSDKQVHIEMTVDAERLELVIEDEGEGFDVSTIPDPRYADNLLKASGRGILLCRLYMDEVIYNDRGNRVTVVSYARNASPPEGPASG